MQTCTKHKKRKVQVTRTRHLFELILKVFNSLRRCERVSPALSFVGKVQVAVCFRSKSKFHHAGANAYEPSDRMTTRHTHAESVLSGPQSSSPSTPCSPMLFVSWCPKHCRKDSSRIIIEHDNTPFSHITQLCPQIRRRTQKRQSLRESGNSGEDFLYHRKVCTTSLLNQSKGRSRTRKRSSQVRGCRSCRPTVRRAYHLKLTPLQLFMLSFDQPVSSSYTIAPTHHCRQSRWRHSARQFLRGPAHSGEPFLSCWEAMALNSHSTPSYNQTKCGPSTSQCRSHAFPRRGRPELRRIKHFDHKQREPSTGTNQVRECRYPSLQFFWGSSEPQSLALQSPSHPGRYIFGYRSLEYIYHSPYDSSS